MALVDGGFELSDIPEGEPNGLIYLEKQDSGRFMLNGDNSYAEIVYLVDWAQVGSFVQYLLGFSTYSDIQAGVYVLSRVLPDIHPRWGNPFGPGSGYNQQAPTGGLYCTDAVVEGQGINWLDGTFAVTQLAEAANSIAYKAAEVKATYRALDYDVILDGKVTSEMQRFCVRTYTYNHQYATFIGQMAFVNGSAAGKIQTTPNQPGKIVGMIEKTMVWYQVPANPTDAWNVPTYKIVKEALGHVNSQIFDGDDVGTVLFLGVDPKRTKPNFVDGAVYWDIAYKFGIMNNGAGVPGDTEKAGWNYVYNGMSNPTGWDLLVASKPPAVPTIADQRIYDNYDLNQLFTVPAT